MMGNIPAVEVPNPDGTTDLKARSADYHYLIQCLIDRFDYQGVVNWMATHGTLDDAVKAVEEMRDSVAAA